MHTVSLVVLLIINIQFISSLQLLAFQPQTTNSNTDDCSFVTLNNVKITPLSSDICTNLPDKTSTKVYCDDIYVFQDTWSALDCKGKQILSGHFLSHDLLSSDFSCDTSCLTSTNKPLLPNPPQQPSPTHAPTTIPSSKPSQSPITHSPTQFGETKTPTLFPSVYSITATDTYDSVDYESMQTNQTQLYIFSMPSIPIHAICLLITVLLFIASIYYLLIKKQIKGKKQIVPSIKIFVLLTFVSNIIGISCLMCIAIIMATNEWTQEIYNMSIIPYYLLSIAYSFGKLCLELFYLFRVYKAFKNSVYSLSKYTLIILICCLSIISFMWCFLFIISTKSNVYVPNYFYLIVSVAEMFLVFILLYLFANRLSSMLLRHKFRTASKSQSKTQSKTESINTTGNTTTSQTPSPEEFKTEDKQNHIQRVSATNSVTANIRKPTLEIYPSTNSARSSVTVSVSGSRMGSSRTSTASISTVPTIKSIESSLSDKQIKWIFLITRCILLSSISLITTIIFGIFAFYYSQFGIHIFIVYMLWSIDMTTNSLCLYLNFIFANKMYNKSCVYCHTICQNVVQKVTARKMLKKHLNDIANLENKNEIIV